LGLDGFGDKLDEYGREIRQRVLKWTGIPVSVGIAKTKTLAKVANHLAKKSAKAKGVLYLDRQRYIDAALEATPVEDVWGVGSRISKKLRQAGIYNARQLSQANLGWVKKQFSVMLVRTVLELRGQKCFELEKVPGANQNITVSRSFGKEVENLQQLRQSVCMYVCRAGEKLRSQNLCAKVVTVFAMNNRFGDSVYYNSASHIFETANESSLNLVQAAAKLTKQVYRKSVKFKKAGVILSKLTPKDQVQLNLFTDWGKFARDKRLMEVLDKINCLEKRVYFAGEGVEKPWQTKFERKSDCYTTRWDELIEVC
jgi:DNA polymerase V